MTDDTLVVADYAPYGVPVDIGIVNEYTRRVMEDTLAEHGDLAADIAFEAMVEEQVRQIRSNPEYRAQLREAFDEIDVNLVIPTLEMKDSSRPYRQRIHHDLSRWQLRIDSLDWMHKVRTPSQAREVARRGDVGVALTIQNHGGTLFLEAATEGDYSEIEFLHNSGVGIMQLTYNSQTHVGHGCTDRSDGGLSQAGVDVVNELTDRGIVVDVSHCSNVTSLDAIQTAERPVSVTHSMCAAHADHPRAKSDEVLKALADNDGYLGLVAIQTFLAPDDPEAGFDRFFDHLEHAVSILGVDRVGIGTDWGNMTSTAVPDELVAGFEEERFPSVGWDVDEHGMYLSQGFGPIETYGDLHLFVTELHERGYTDSEVNGLLGENFVDYWERAKGE
jgi:membrane dipeptidase